MSSADRPTLPRDLAGTVAHAGVNPTLEGRALQDALRRAIATRRGYCSWDVDHAGWVVTLQSPDEQDFYDRTLEEALAWCLVWLLAKGTPGDWGHDLGIGQIFLRKCLGNRPGTTIASPRALT